MSFLRPPLAEQESHFISMNIFITLDYELYFGKKSGSAEKCLLFPTNKLIELAQKYNAKFSFFIDAGYLIKLEEYKHKFKQLENNYNAVTSQIKQLVSLGHDCQLHVHPHWEDSIFNGSEWIMNINRYKIGDFSDLEAEAIIKKYAQALVKVTNQPLHTFRAGGWCIQPFSKFKKALTEIGIKIDSTIYKNGKQVIENYNYDFNNCPNKHEWRFSDNPTKEDPNGAFLELPIYAQKFSPLFFWKLFLLGRLNPTQHKSLGDGYSVSVKGYRKRLLTTTTLQCANIEGYFSTTLDHISRKAQKEGVKNLVIIGHPKALTLFSIKKLDEYLKKYHTKFNFTTFTKTFSS